MKNSLFDYAPELGMFWGRYDVDHGRFTDYTLPALEKWQKQEDNFLHVLNNMDEKTLIGTPDYYTYLLLKESLKNKHDIRICKEELWDVNPALVGTTHGKCCRKATCWHA